LDSMEKELVAKLDECLSVTDAINWSNFEVLYLIDN
jgi:hypothetical protein